MQKNTNLKRVVRKNDEAVKVEMFRRLIQQELGIERVPEYRIHSERKWRFDYVMPDKKIAIECEGVVWTRGRCHGGDA